MYFFKKKVQALKILLLSDIHQQKAYLHKLEKWYLNQNKNNGLHFDYVFISGDTGTIKYKQQQQPTQQEQIQSEAKMIEILKKLQVFNNKILYIPGNHDCLVQFQDKVLTDQSINIHKKVHKITQDLYIIGFGGSPPAYLKGQMKWQGYPYKNQQELKKQFQSFQKQTKGKQYILMTHTGPIQSSTTIDRCQEQIQSGSQTILKYIQKQRDQIVINIHGHTHACQGSSIIKQVPILNPGAIAKGNFGILDLRKKQKWGLQSYHLYNLNNM